jgi:hypothetical protein
VLQEGEPAHAPAAHQLRVGPAGVRVSISDTVTLSLRPRLSSLIPSVFLSVSLSVCLSPPVFVSLRGNTDHSRLLRQLLHPEVAAVVPVLAHHALQAEGCFSKSTHPDLPAPCSRYHQGSPGRGRAGCTRNTGRRSSGYTCSRRPPPWRAAACRRPGRASRSRTGRPAWCTAPPGCGPRGSGRSRPGTPANCICSI